MAGWSIAFLLPTTLVVALAACAQDQALRPHAPPAALGPESGLQGHRRGIVECREDQACGAPRGPAIDAPPVPVTAEDVAIRFLRVGDDGRRQVLENGGALAQGEAFAIVVEARRDAHVYLWHTDPQGRLAELVGASGVLGSRDCGRANRLRAGQTVQFPAPDGHYTMDEGAGVERIYPVVSAAPLCGTDRARQGERLRTGSPPACSGGASACGQVFVIRHLAQV